MTGDAMTDNSLTLLQQDDPEQIIEPVGYDFGFSRRSFMQVLGAGVLISATSGALLAQERRGRDGRGRGAAARVVGEAAAAAAGAAGASAGARTSTWTPACTSAPTASSPS